MDQSLGYLAHTRDLLLVVLGFGLIIFVHELGHFLAAKWAGIRVLAFAIGFGPAALSWRKGLGFRRGTSEPEYQALLHRDPSGVTTIEGARTVAPSDLSPTEYRLNWLPFGGYVKMLGQEDVNPAAVSDAPDSYQNTPVWKRMIVISAGVVFNLIAAAALFIAVFMHGLETEPPVIGIVTPGSPASRAVAVGAPGIEPGLRPGDRVLSTNGNRAQSFNDIVLASAMSRRGDAMGIRVERPGVAKPVDFEVRPEAGSQSRLLEIGVTPAFSATILNPPDAADRALVLTALQKDGLAGVEPGMTLVSAAGKPVVSGASDLVLAARDSGGAPVPLVFRAPDGRTVNALMKPTSQLQSAQVALPTGTMTGFTHLLGLTPVLKVDGLSDTAPRQGLKAGDIFARVGGVAYPSLPDGIAEIKRHHGRTIDVTVLRPDEHGTLAPITIDPPPMVNETEGGQIGFFAGEDLESNILAVPPTAVGNAGTLPAAAVVTQPGLRLVAVNGRTVSNFAEISAALRQAADAAAPASGTSVALEFLGPIGAGESGADHPKAVEWRLSAQDVQALRQLQWAPPVRLSLFEPAEFTLKADGPSFLARSGNAIRMGVHETNRVMWTTYLTFARLFEGTVKVEHLKGPVGIAHMGTKIASRGTTWLLFFMALISVNLAVVNFLPLPIVDGGQFIFLVLEQIRGRPLSIQIQNVATIAGLILIGTMFIIVTFNDIMKLFG